jgi:predicted AlkP superfamily pyrophosphatase or phosphodiesterase
VVLVSLDGFRADYLMRPAAVPLRTLARQGVASRAMEPVFPTKTFPNHYSLVTGLYPEHHGIVSNTMEDPALGRFTIRDTMAVRDARWWGGEPLWVTAETRGVRAASFFWPGSEAAIRGVRPTWWMRFDDSVPHSVRVSQVLEWLKLPIDSAPRFVTLYFSEVDGAGHRFGPDAPETDSAIATVSRNVEALWQGITEAGLSNRVNLIVVADHGMSATSSSRVIVLDDYLPLELVHIVDLSPVAMLVPAAGREAEVLESLRRVPHLTAWRREDIPERLHYRANPRITPITALADPGWTITTRARLASVPLVGGQHGYDSSSPDMQALFMATGPAFPAGRVVERVRAVDMYELMAHVLGLRPAPNDGSLDSIRVVLR